MLAASRWDDSWARSHHIRRAPGSTGKTREQYLSGKPIRYYRPRGSADIRHLIDEGFQAFNAARLGEACRIFTDKMLLPEHDTTIALTIAGALTPAGLGGCIVEVMERGLIDFLISTGANLYHDLHYALNFTLHRGSPFVNDVELYQEGVIRIYDVLFPSSVLLETDAYIRDFIVRSGLNEPVATSEFHYRLGKDLLERFPGCEEHSVVARAAVAGVPIYTSSPGDSSIGMNIAYHELMNDSRLMIDPNKDVNEVCALIFAGKKNGCVILGGGSPKNFYLQGQPTLWEVYGIPKGGNDYFIQLTTDQVVWGGLSGATPAEAVSWGKVNPGVLPDTVVAYCDSTIAFPLFCEYAVGATHGRRPRKELVHKRDALVAQLRAEAKNATRTHPRPEETTETMPDLERHLMLSGCRSTRACTWTRMCPLGSSPSCAMCCTGTSCSCSSTTTCAARRTWSTTGSRASCGERSSASTAITWTTGNSRRPTAAASSFSRRPRNAATSRSSSGSTRRSFNPRSAPARCRSSDERYTCTWTGREIQSHSRRDSRS